MPQYNPEEVLRPKTGSNSSSGQTDTASSGCRSDEASNVLTQACSTVPGSRSGSVESDPPRQSCWLVRLIDFAVEESTTGASKWY